MSNLLNRFQERKNIKVKQRDYDRQTSQKYGVTQGDIKLAKDASKFADQEEKIDFHTKTKVLPAMGVGAVKWVSMMGQQKGW